MESLKGVDAEFAALQGGDAFGCGSRGGNGRHSGDVVHDGGAADGLLVEKRINALRRVDYELNALTFDQVNHVGAAFFYLVHAINFQASLFKHVRGTRSCDDLESEFEETPGNIGNVAFVMIGDADEYRALRGQHLAGGDLSLGEGLAEIVGHAHDFAG